MISVIPTWNGVVQDKAEKSSDEHMGGEEHHDDLVQLLHACTQNNECIQPSSTAIFFWSPASLSWGKGRVAPWTGHNEYTSVFINVCSEGRKIILYTLNSSCSCLLCSEVVFQVSLMTH